MQPEAELPASVNPLWMLMQPIKDESDPFPNPEYSLLEQQFWATALIRIDAALAADADQENPAGVVWRVATSQDTQPSHTAINTIILDVLTKNPEALYFGFTHGILPDLAELYNSPRMTDDSRRRMHTVIVGGAHGNEIRTTRVLTQLPEKEIREAPLIIVHDDVVDTVAALAAFVEKIRSIRSNTAYNEAFVERFSSKTTTDADRLAAYDQLIALMQNLNIVAAIPVHKNAVFVSKFVAATQANTEWSIMQKQFLMYRLEYTGWLMGDGMDTDISVESVYDLIPDEVKNHPAVQGLFEHTRKSKIRIGSTIKGLVVLKEYPDDKDRAMNDLKKWVANKITEYLKNYIDASSA